MERLRKSVRIGRGRAAVFPPRECGELFMTDATVLPAGDGKASEERESQKTDVSRIIKTLSRKESEG